MMHERGVEVDHSGLNSWVLKYTPAPVTFNSLRLFSIVALSSANVLRECCAQLVLRERHDAAV